ncbi:hypothetical protein N0M98_13355 [Paenibacillus doosanensis]|nr:hypothetical protein [Paenibacillus doosanensis]MCS7461135.1 hypothetical protein [Paenibacillus doosanensis]
MRRVIVPLCLFLVIAVMGMMFLQQDRLERARSIPPGSIPFLKEDKP